MSGNKLEDAMTAVSILLSIIYMTVGTFGNSMTLVVVWRTPTLSTPVNFFIINLAIADLLVSIIVNPFYITISISDKWPFDGMLCNFVVFLTIWSVACSVVNLAAIAYNRYVCILKPSRYKEIFTKKRTIWMCFAVWGFAFLPVLPLACGFGSLGYNDHSKSCTLNVNDADSRKYLSLWVINIFVITTIMIFCYVRVVRKVSTSMEKTKTSKLKKPQLAMPTEGNTDEVSAKRIKKKEYNLAKNLMVVSTAFMICWAPMWCASIAKVSGAIIPQQLWQAMVLITLLNSAINPIIYAWKNKQFRKAYIQILEMLCRQSTT